MKLLLGEQITALGRDEARLYARGLMELVHKTRGNRRLIRELQLTLTHLQTAAPEDYVGVAYV